ncbi:MAG: F0F1 ATP synthase subunit alpha, partial [Gammaproteobacteria bacterium]
AAFAQFASDLDEATRKQLERGQRVTELMKQDQYAPLSVAEMALSLFAANEGYLDDVEANEVVAFEKAMHSFARSSHQETLDAVNAEPKLSEEVDSKFRALLDDFKANHTW